jgi:hypothetical protein
MRYKQADKGTDRQTKKINQFHGLVTNIIPNILYGDLGLNSTEGEITGVTTISRTTFHLTTLSTATFNMIIPSITTFNITRLRILIKHATA